LEQLLRLKFSPYIIQGLCIKRTLKREREILGVFSQKISPNTWSKTKLHLKVNSWDEIKDKGNWPIREIWMSKEG
jgi:hypothetical protein